MSGVRASDVVAIVITVSVTVGYMAAAIRHTSRRTPVGIVRRLHQTGKPVIVQVGGINTGAWDPSRPGPWSQIYKKGVAAYTLVDPSTVNVHFIPRDGKPFDRSGPIPESRHPDHPETRRRQWTARLVIAIYLVVGLAAFAVTAANVSGVAGVRARSGALVAFVAVAVAWLITHVVLSRRQLTTPDDEPRPKPLRAKHVLSWAGVLILISAILGVAWHLQGGDEPHPQSWAGSMIDAVIFVLVSAATLVAANHHHHYVHHRD